MAGRRGAGGWPLWDGLTKDEKLWAMLAHLVGIIGYSAMWGQHKGPALVPFIGPLVIYLFYQGKSKFVSFHALQSLFFQLGTFGTVFVITQIPLIGWFLGWIGSLLMALAVIYAVIAAIFAYDGRLFEYIIVGKFARRHLQL